MISNNKAADFSPFGDSGSKKGGFPGSSIGGSARVTNTDRYREGATSAGYRVVTKHAFKTKNMYNEVLRLEAERLLDEDFWDDLEEPMGYGRTDRTVDQGQASLADQGSDEA